MMPWARLDDTFYDHPKLDSLGKDRLAGVGLFVVAVSWSNRFLTDGFLPTDRVTRLGGTRRLAEALCHAGLWESVEGGFRIHDFLHYSKSRDRVGKEREEARDRQAKSRGMSQRDNGEVTGAPSRTRTSTRSTSSKPEHFADVVAEISSRARAS